VLQHHPPWVGGRAGGWLGRLGIHGCGGG
jgi:hypothetical protein